MYCDTKKKTANNNWADVDIGHKNAAMLVIQKQNFSSVLQELYKKIIIIIIIIHI